MLEQRPNRPPISEPQHAPHDRGNVSPGLPPTLHERAKPPPESHERQPLPSVWDVLERDVRFGERYDNDFPTRQEYEEGRRELDELNRLKSELHEKGIARYTLILDLYNTVTLEPSGLPVLIPYNRSLSPEEYQQFRSEVERLSEEQLTAEIHKAKENFKRREEVHPGRRPPPPGTVTV
jgi:hypothetical protein